MVGSSISLKRFIKKSTNQSLKLRASGTNIALSMTWLPKRSRAQVYFFNFIKDNKIKMLSSGGFVWSCKNVSIQLFRVSACLGHHHCPRLDQTGFFTLSFIFSMMEMFKVTLLLKVMALLV
jgi:hypothetical protein